MSSQESNLIDGIDRLRKLAQEMMQSASAVLMQIGYLEAQLTNGPVSSNMNTGVEVVENAPAPAAPDIYANMEDPYGTATDGDWEPIAGNSEELPFGFPR